MDLSQGTAPPHRTSTQIPERYREIGRFYLVPLAASAPISIFLNYVWGGTPIVRGHSLALIASFVGAAASLVLWILYRNAPQPDLRLLIFLVGNLLGWTVIASLVWLDKDQFNLGTWLAPLVFLGILVKPPKLQPLFCAADLFALGLLTIAVLSQIMHLTGILPFPTDGAPSRLPLIAQNLGLEQRWVGPFASTSDAGPVGGFLAAYALIRHSFLRSILFVGGLLILAVTSSHTAVTSLTLSLVVTTWFLTWPKNTRIRIWFRLVLTFCVLGTSILIVAATNPTLNARIPIWIDYLAAWIQYPLVGLGTNGILANMEMFTHQHAHNYYIDILTRHGLVGFLATVPLIIFALVTATQAGRRGLVAMPGLVVYWTLALVGETLIDWRYLGYVLLEFLFIGLIATTYLRETRHDLKPRAETQLAISPSDREA